MIFFRKKTTLWQKIVRAFEAIFVGTAIVVYWRGIWNLCDMYFDSHSLWWNVITTGCALLVLLFMGKFVEHLFGDVEDDIEL